MDVGPDPSFEGLVDGAGRLGAVGGMVWQGGFSYLKIGSQQLER